jgi:hypothetical protein
MLTIPQIESLRNSDPHLYESLRRLLTGVNAIGTTNKLNLDTAIADGPNFARVAADALTANAIDPSKPGVLAKGAIPPTWNTAFTYAATPTSITFNWSGLQIYRADGTATPIPNGSLAISALTAGTTYYFYPYYDESARSLEWVAAGTGSPPNAQSAKTNAAAQQQSLQGRIPLSQGAILAATPLTGTAGGSGGGSGNCVRSGTVVLCQERGTVPIDTCQIGEHLLGPGYGGVGPRGREAWTRIARIDILPADTFIRLHLSNEESLDVTPHHIFTLADGSPMRAERLCLADVLVGRFARLTLRKIEAIVKEGKKVTISCEPFHQFFAGRFAATVLTHNYTFNS